MKALHIEEAETDTLQFYIHVYWALKVLNYFSVLVL